MNVLRNIFGSRGLSLFRQNGQNALFNISQSTEAAQQDGPLSSRTKRAQIESPKENGLKWHHLIPKSLLDSTIFNGQLIAPAIGSNSPTTIKKYRSLERKVELIYRCKKCNTRNSNMVTEAAYSRGIVIMQCDFCATDNIIIDNLGWFSNTEGKSFDEVLANNSSVIKVIKVNERGEII